MFGAGKILQTLFSQAEPIPMTYLLQADWASASDQAYTNAQSLDTEAEGVFDGALTVAEADGTASVVDNQLAFTAQSTPAWGDLAVRSDAITRATGSVFLVQMRTDDTMKVVLSNSTTITNTANYLYDLYIFSDGVFTVISRSGTAEIAKVGRFVPQGLCQVAIVLGGYNSSGIPYRSGETASLYNYGCSMFVRHPYGHYPTWRLLYRSPKANTSTLYPTVLNYSAGCTVDLMAVPDDTFETMLEIDNYTASPTATHTFVSGANASIEYLIGSLGGSTMDVRFRYQDSSNHWYVQISNTGGVFLNRRISGTGSTIDSEPSAGAGAGDYITIVCDGSSIIVLLNGVNLLSATDSNFTTQDDVYVENLGGGTITYIASQQLIDSGLANTLNTVVQFEKTSDLNKCQYLGGYASNPVVPVSGSGSDTKIRELSNVLYEPADTGKEYKLWYTGYDSGSTTDEKVHYAYSSDGETWTKYGSNPIIAARYEDPYTVKNGSTYYIYVEDKANQGADGYIRRFSATNPEGTWTDDGRCTGLFTGDEQSPIVWIEGSTWHMLFEKYPATPNEIFYATSSDGLAWTLQNSSNPVLAAADTDWIGSNQDVVCDDIVKIDTTYYMTYHAYDGSQYHVAIATSTDLVNWSDTPHSPLAVAEINSAGTDSAFTLTLYHDGTEYVALYYQADTLGIHRGYPMRSVLQ